jgi:hypothetical protein
MSNSEDTGPGGRLLVPSPPMLQIPRRDAENARFRCPRRRPVCHLPFRDGARPPVEERAGRVRHDEVRRPRDGDHGQQKRERIP